MRCNIWYNYGQNINILLAAAVIGVIGFLLNAFLVPRLSAGPSKKILAIIGYFFGIRYIALWLDAVMIDLFGYVLINLRALDSSKTSSIYGGFFTSIIVVLLYICLYSSMFISLRRAKRESDTAGRLTIDRFNDQKKGLGVLSCVLFDYREDIHKSFFVYMPILFSLKNVIVHLIIVSVGDRKAGSLIPILCIEVLYAAIVCLGRVKKHLFDNVYDISISVCTCAYILMKVVTSKEGVSIYMVIVLYLMTYILIISIGLRYKHFIYSIKILSSKTSPSVQPKASISSNKQPENELAKSPKDETSKMVEKETKRNDEGSSDTYKNGASESKLGLLNSTTPEPSVTPKVTINK